MPVRHSVQYTIATGTEPRVRTVRGEQRRVELAASELAWTASGTATLECTLLDVPMVVGYRLQPLSFALAKLLVNVPNVALVNLISGLIAYTHQPKKPSLQFTSFPRLESISYP